MFVYNIVLIGFAVSPASSSAVRNLATISTCRESESTCLDGTCISAGAVCDAHWDCPDGSDEASCYSSTNSNLTEAAGFHQRYRRQSPCGLYQWQCTDGTCIAVDKKCDGKTDCPDRSDETHAQCKIIKRSIGSRKCVLPPYPEHGTYVAINAPDATPGQGLDYTQLNITCEQGYGVVSDALPYCLDGTWFIPIQKCVSFCRLDTDVSVHYKCWVPETDIYRICNQFEPMGTLVKPECNTPVYGSKDDLLSMICRRDGKWNRIIKCKPECGRVTPDAEGLIWGGTEAIRGELPWHVAIYRKPTQIKNYYEQICGGSIVSNRIVISAAHCFWDSGRDKKQAASNFAVATAKLFREWDHKDDKDAQKSELKSIELTPYYRGVRTNFQHDLAVLILETPFVYYTYVRPVCLDLIDINFNKQQLQVGNFGKVAGWGLTAENGPASPVLKVVELPFVSIPECIRSTPQTFTESITADKICAGYNNGTGAVCRGDSGGGLSFPETERRITRYYLRGVVSTAPRPDGTQGCNVNTVTTFTEIYQHKDFINQFMSTTCILPPYPEHGLYEVVGNPTAKPGDDAENVYLKVSCDHGYNMIGNSVVLCIRGDRFTKMPECVQDPMNVVPREPDKTQLQTNPAENTNRPEQSGKCVLPEYPEHGNYTVTNAPAAKPGERFKSLTLTFICLPGFEISRTEIVFCIDGLWSDSFPKCIRFCKLDYDTSVHYQCLVTGSIGGYRTCNPYEPSGTTVKPECNRPNYYSTIPLHFMRCIDGYWDYVAVCSPECGTVHTGGVPLIIDGMSTSRGEMPWHVGIYRKTTEPYMQICGGSLVSNKVVLSAAHCFWNDNSKQQSASMYGVAADKIYRPWDDVRDVAAQKSDVKEIKIPVRFQGNAANYQDDIAVLVLETPFEYTTFVRPVCLDFQAIFERKQLQPGNMGKVAGWGLTGENGQPSQVLKIVKLPYVSIEQCISTSPPDFREYITSDKFCAGYTNGTALCRGDNGGGLAFPETDRGTERYYLRGIVSVAARSENLCNIRTPTAFTQISKHEDIIKEYL